MKFFSIMIVMFLSGCTSIASSTAAYVVAVHSQKIERDTRRYKGIDRCFIPNKPVAFNIANKILSGSDVGAQYQVVLNPELKEKEPYPPYYVAYAYITISKRLGDVRADNYIYSLKRHLLEEEVREVEEFIEYKYLQSYLTKCFDVPYVYKKRLKDRELIKTN